MRVKFEAIFFREIIAAAVITVLYAVAGWDVREPLAVFGMFGCALFLQEWAIDKWEEGRHAKMYRATSRKHSARRAA